MHQSLAYPRAFVDGWIQSACCVVHCLIAGGYAAAGGSLWITHVLLCLQAWTLLLAGPFLDRYISASWVFNYDWNVPALTFLGLSCACAVGVNVSQFMCLGRFSAVSYQVRIILLQSQELTTSLAR